MYTIIGTQPNIAYTILVVSRYAANPDDSCQMAVKWIFQYLQDTIQLKLTYRGLLQPLARYFNSNYASDPATQRSTSGYIFNLGSAAISWLSKRQLTVALSTCEAEYMGQVNATKEAIQLEQLLEKLTQIILNPTITPHINPKEVSENYTLITAQMGGIDTIYTITLTIVIFYNNQKAIALAKDPTNYSKIKYIYIKYIFL